MKILNWRGVNIVKVSHSRYKITQGDDTFKFGSFRAAVDFANFICEDRAREEAKRLAAIQHPDAGQLPFKTFGGNEND